MVLRVFCNWWKWVVPIGVLLSLTAGLIVWYVHVPKFEATALIKIEAEAPYIAFEDGTSGKGSDRYVQTQIELLRGQVVLIPLLSRPEIALISEINENADPLRHLQENLSVRQVGQSELYEVSFVSPSPQDATTVANLVVAEYLSTQNREDKQLTQIVIDVLEKERLERGTKVEQVRKRVVELAKDVTGKDPFGQGAVTDVTAFSPAASLYQSVTEADVEWEVARAELQALTEAPIVVEDGADSPGLLEFDVANRADVRQGETRIAAIAQQMDAIESKPRQKIGDTWETDPEYIRLTASFEQAQSDLRDIKEAARKAERERLIAAKRKELRSLEKKRELLATKFNEHLDELKRSSAQSAELEFAKSELHREEKVFELIAARKLALQIELRAPARVSLVHSARVPLNAIEPIPYKLIVLACALSLIAPLAVAIAFESIVRRISNPEQLTTESRLPVLGEIARFPMRKVAADRSSLPVVQQRDLFVFAESIDSLRTSLMLTEHLGTPGQERVIAFCSAVSGEGKTSVATSMAMSVAEATQQPTLIIDADLRFPDVATFFNVPESPGVSEVLTGHASIAEALHRVGDTHAYVMPAGKLEVNPHHILNGAKVEELLQTLRKKFSTIIIDTPPVLSASESLVYAKAADLVVFCTLADTSRAGQVRVAAERLQQTGANLTGAVLSGVSMNRYGYRYGTYAR